MPTIIEKDLKTLQTVKLNAIVLQLKAEMAAVESARAMAEARSAELEHENVTLKIYINYGLTNKHIINETTGECQLKEENESTS
jgi:hypothetical protein